MDILKLITDKDRLDFTENYDYKTSFVTSPLFPARKTDNMKLEMSRLVEGGDLPVMAQFHALDTEARIGDRTNYKTIEFEKLFIKEKINQTERISMFLNGVKDEQKLVNFIYDDMGNLVSRVQTRAELANCQVLSTGKLTINENNYKTVVDYGYQSSHNISLNDWANPSHSIVEDLNALLEQARKDGKVITRALTSSKVVSYLVANEEIKGFFEKSGQLVTRNRVLQWVYENFGIAFATNDDVYKLSANDKTTHRFYPENKITFFNGTGALGAGLYGVTPEELELTETMSRGMVVITQWKTSDPVATWTKASAMYLPVISDIDGIYIGTIA